MRIKITMINGDFFDFSNPDFDTLSKFIDNQIIKLYYTIDPKRGIAIRTSNILKIEHLDVKGRTT